MDLLAGSLGFALSARAARAAVEAGPEAPAERVLNRDSGALVLPGGGARGAYEAGVIEGLRETSGRSDGEPLPGIDIVAGTSIGAVNGWFVATAQYTKLRTIWATIASEHIFQVKRQYLATITPSSGILTRVFEAALLSRGLTTNVTGLLDGSRIRRWLERNVDPAIPVVVPFLFTLTNLDYERSEVFFRAPFQATQANRDTANRRLRSLFGSRIALREIEDRHLVAALAGSSAIPIVFDPVTIDFDDGPLTYVDGGVADSAPIDLARIASRRVRLILVDPAQARPARFASAAAVGTAAFGIAQNRVLEASLRSAYLETRGKKLFDSTTLSPEQKRFFENVFDVELSLIRPEHELEVSVTGFDDAEGIAKTYESGRQAGLKGFAPYDPGESLR